MRFRKSAHAVYKTEYHLVWIPRYRRRVFVKGVREYTEKVLSHIPDLDPDIEVVKVNVQEDHVHLVIVIPPRIAVARVVRYIKTHSAKKLKAKFPFLQKAYSSKEGIWSRGYCVSCIGLAHLLQEIREKGGWRLERRINPRFDFPAGRTWCQLISI